MALTIGLAIPCIAQGIADNKPTPERIAQERENVAALKQAAFGRLRDLHAYELRSDFPERTRVSLYIGLLNPRFRLQQVAISFDGKPPIVHDYSPKQARLLQRDHLQRVARVNLAPGVHSASVRYIGVLPRPFLDDKPVDEQIDLEFEKSERAESILVPFSPKLVVGQPLEDEGDWRQRQLRKDPRLSMVRFQRANGRYYDALIDLLAMAGPRSDSKVLPLSYDIELAQSYVDFGMREQADAALRTAFDTGVEVQELADVWLSIAELDFERGNLSRAFELLQYLRDDLAPAQLVRWQDTLSRLYLSEGQYGLAREVLEMGDNSMEVLTDANVATNQTPVMRFNYAIALLRDGEQARGRTLLERLGRITDFAEDQRTLRDKANLVLGSHFLRNAQGATAKNILGRIRLDGPYSDQALLALGWSELAPPGSRQPRALVGDEPDPGEYGSRNADAGRIIKPDQSVRLREDPFSRIQLGPFRRAKMAKNEDKATEQAMLAWIEAAQGNPLQPAVQEAMIALPYGLSKLGKLDQASNDYKRSVERLEQARTELSGYVDTRGLDLDAIARGDLDALPQTSWMLQLLAGEEFDEHLQNYLTLNRIREDLRRLQTYGSQGLSLRLSESAQRDEQARVSQLAKIRQSLADSAAVQARFARQALSRGIEKQLDALDEYLISARLGVATFQEEIKAREERNRQPPDK